MSEPTNIAHYRILSKLGEGGMGAVYRATDTKLNREVAIKVLPPSFANDPERLSRFTREAQVLAALNHPNIAAIYGVEERAIVMELVEGEDLKGPLPLDTVLNYAGQLAEALEAAHEKGIVHRDLKPANIKVTPQGVLKVLDFGLAKVNETTASTGATATLSATQAGAIMGTAAYMSPEQARGQQVDQRADIWAFGVILWELLTGRRLFEGNTFSDVLASVLKSTPDLTQVPEKIRPLLAACLEHDPRKRLRHAGDWRLLLAEPAAPPKKTSPLVWIAAAITALLAGLALWMWPRPQAERQLTVVDLEIGADAQDPALSRHGRRVAFVVNRQLAVRDLNSAAIRYLPHTENATLPFFSPDGKSIAYFVGRQLHTIAIEDGTPVLLCPVQAVLGGTWAENGIIYVSDFFGGKLTSVPASGGKCETTTPSKGVGPTPQVLPGGKWLLTARNGVYATPLAGGEPKLLIPEADSVRYLPQSRHLLYHRRGVIYSVRFDADRLETSGASLSLLDGLKPNNKNALVFELAGPSGTLVYREGTQVDQMVAWLEQNGTFTSLVDEPARYSSLRLSPDDTRLAVAIEKENRQLFLIDTRTRQLTRVFDQQGPLQDFPVWSPDGETLALRNGVLTSLNLSTRTTVELSQNLLPWSFTPDGKMLLVSDALGLKRRIRGLPVERTPAGLRYGAPQVLAPLPGDQSLPDVSPDGKWIAFNYRKVAGGVTDIYVSPFRPGDSGEPKQKWQISVGGGARVRWTRNGQLFFAANGRVMSASYSLKDGVFQASKPHVWSDRPISSVIGAESGTFDVDAGGKRVVTVLNREEPKTMTHLRVMLNVVDEIARRENGGK